MPFTIESALWLADRTNPSDGFVLITGWCFVDSAWRPVDTGAGFAAAIIDIAVSTASGQQVFEDLQPIEPRADIQANFPGAPLNCGFHFVLPVAGRPVGDVAELRVKHAGAVVATIRIHNIVNCADTASAAAALGIDEAMTRKLDNLLINEHERLSGSIVKRSKPISLYVDPAFNCNLKCPHCISENLRAKRFNRPVLKQDMFEHILEVYGPELIRVTFTLWGEPLLNRRLPDFVRRVKQHGVFVEMSTNLSVPLSDIHVDEIVTAGFDEIRLSIDGATQEIYERYRVGGSLDLVLDNLRRIVAAKRRLGRRTPLLKWQFLEWPWNRHEISEALRLAREIGVDFFYTLAGDPWQVNLQRRDRLPEDEAAPFDPDLKRRVQERRDLRRRNRHAVGCDFLDHTMAINSDGSIHPCCYVVEPKDSVGHVLGDDGQSQFNTPAIQRLRRFVKDLSGEALSGPSPCVGCGSLAAGHIPDHLDFDAALKLLKQGSAPRHQPLSTNG